MEQEMVTAAKALLLRDRRALILRRGQGDKTAPGMWEFPGGKLEFGESPEQAVVREVAEETGLAAATRRVLYAASLLTSPQRQVVVINYLAQAGEGEVAISFEHQDYLWATKADMLRLLDPDILRNIHGYHVFDAPDVDIED